MSNLHPLFVHFPVALLTVSLMFEIAFLLRSSAEFTRVAWWLHLVGSAGLLVSIATGLLARSGVAIPSPAVSHVEVHEEIALLVATIFTGLLFWRIRARGVPAGKGRGLYIAAFGFGVLLMWVGAWYGGELVYRFGVGAATP